MTDMLRYKWTSFGPMLDEDGPFVLLVDAEAAMNAMRKGNDDPFDALRSAYEQGQRDAIAAAVQRMEVLWSLDPSWDGTNWNNALTSALSAIDALKESHD